MGLQYGNELPDQVDRLNDVVTKHLSLLSDTRELVRERAALEKEYSQKLQVIAKRAVERRAKSAPGRVIGEDPSKAWGDDAIKQSTLEAAYALFVESFENTAQDHSNLSELLISKVVNELKVLEQKKDDTRRKQMQFFQKVVSERDKWYAEHTKAKQKYEEDCLEIETYRQKQDRAQDDRHADRAAKQYEQQRIDMLISKNTYLTSIAAANQTKAKYFNIDLPIMENQFQDLQTHTVKQLVRIMSTAQTIQNQHIDSMRYKISLVEKSLADVSPAADQDLFIQFNKRPFTAPSDWEFEPCASFYDSSEMSVEPEAKVFLQNKVARSQAKLAEVKPVLQFKEHEYNQLQKLVEAYLENPSLGDVDQVTNNALDAFHAQCQLATTHTALEAEIDTILTALGGDQGAQQPHQFKSSSFSIPTPCVFCKSSIWGLSKQGKTCKACGLSVHAKCELKIPADCPGSRGKVTPAASRLPTTGTGSKLSVTSSTLTNSSRKSVAESTAMSPSSTLTRSSFGSPTADDSPSATIMFDFTASSAFELSVSTGDVVKLLEQDDGSGWAKVDDGRGGKGLVPATYIQLADSTGPGPAKSPKSQGSGKFVKGVYAYSAQGDDEISVSIGGKIELTPVGHSYADGWSEGIDSQGRKGIFPSNYVEPF